VGIYETPRDIWTAFLQQNVNGVYLKTCVNIYASHIYIYVDRFISQDGAPRLSNLRIGEIVGGGIFQLMFVQRSIFNMEILRYFAE